MRGSTGRFLLSIFVVPAVTACAGTGGQGVMLVAASAEVKNVLRAPGSAPACASPTTPTTPFIQKSSVRRANVRWRGWEGWTGWTGDSTDARRIIRVRVNGGNNLPGWSESDKDQAISALKQWEATGIPLRFEIVPIDSTADLTICWVDRFAAPYGGWTSLQWDSKGFIYAASITMALRDADGNDLSVAARDAIVIHEAGHAIGLPHAATPAAIMWPVVGEGSRMSANDSTAARRLYSISVAAGK